MKRRLLRGGLILLGLLAVGGVVLVSGVYRITARPGHWEVTEWVLHFALKRSVATHTIGTKVPPLDERRLVLMGAGHYEGGCRPCHGRPGAPLPRIPQHMTPHPPDLSTTVGEYDDAELHYIVFHGIKMTGMPAWPSEHREDEVWALVAFLRTLPDLDAEGYARLVHGEVEPMEGAPEVVVQVCARCHGTDGLGRGEGAFPRLAGQRPAYLRASLVAYAEGARHSGIMEPIAADLDAEQLTEIVDWYAGLPPPEGLGVRAGTRGEEIALRGIPDSLVPACVHCHGPDEGPHHAVYPELAGQYAEYLALQLELFSKETRGGTEYAELMRVVTAHELEPDDVEAVARYYAALPPERDDVDADRGPRVPAEH